MTRLLLLLICLSASSGSLWAREIVLDPGDSTPTGLRLSGDRAIAAKGPGLDFEVHVNNLTATEVETPRGIFTQLNVPGSQHSSKLGAPALPVMHRLIEVPLGAKVKVQAREADVREYSLDELKLAGALMPRQPSQPKSGPRVPFAYERSAYLTGGFQREERAAVEDLGLLRDKHLVLLKVSPVAYDPVRGVLEISRDVKVTLTIQGVDLKAAAKVKASYRSAYFDGVARSVLTPPSLAKMEAKAVADGVCYAIVADRMFEADLQPFIQWKRSKGFRVVVGYTDVIGASVAAITSFVHDLYNNPDPANGPPDFLLLVGDTAQVPSHDGKTDLDDETHITDLYYATVTPGDALPDILYGRFSARSSAELLPQIQKTLEYEKYQMPDPSFLREVVLVAGWDDSCTRPYGWPQHNYGVQNYFNAAHGFDDVSVFLTSGPNQYEDDIRAAISSGCAFVNYTAHANETGWADPSFTVSDVRNLQNTSKYPLAVGNCCRSNRFQVDTCFGEALLRGSGKGAIGYIGGSNYTLWDEDLWFGVGYYPIVLPNDAGSPPARQDTGAGAYDGAFDGTHPTQGGMLLAGNLAVQASDTSWKLYYWEIYHLMGDPSVMVFWGVPPNAAVSYPNAVDTCTTTLAVAAPAGALVAASMNGVSLGACFADAQGNATIALQGLQEGTISLVVTGRNLRPHFGSINAVGLPSAGLSAGTWQVPAQICPGAATVISVRLSNTRCSPAIVDSVALQFGPQNDLSTTPPTVPFTLGPSQTALLTFPAVVPETASPGDRTVTLVASGRDSKSGALLSCRSTADGPLTVLAPPALETRARDDDVPLYVGTSVGTWIHVIDTGRCPATFLAARLLFDDPGLGATLQTGLPLTIGAGSGKSLHFIITAGLQTARRLHPMTLELTWTGASSTQHKSYLTVTPGLTVKSHAMIEFGPWTRSTLTRNSTFDVPIRITNTGDAGAAVTGASLASEPPGLDAVLLGSLPPALTVGEGYDLRFRVQVAADAAPGPITPTLSVSAREVITGLDVSAARAVTPIPRILRPGQLEGGTLAGDLAVWRLRVLDVAVPLTNTGESEVRVTAASLTFVPAEATAACLQSLPFTVGPGAVWNLPFRVRVHVDAGPGVDGWGTPTGPWLLQPTFAAVATDVPSAQAAGVTAQLPPGLRVMDPAHLEIGPRLGPVALVRGQDFVESFSLRNTGELEAQLDSVRLSYGSVDVTATARPGNPRDLAGGAPATFWFDAHVASVPTPGPLTPTLSLQARERPSQLPFSKLGPLVPAPGILWPVRLRIGSRSGPLEVSRKSSFLSAVSVSNTGDCTVSVTSAVLAAGAGISTRCSEVPPWRLPGRSVRDFPFGVTVSATAVPGSRVLTLQLSGSEEGSSLPIAVNGPTDPPLRILSPARLTFGTLEPRSVSLGQTFHASVRVSNAGESPTSISTAVISFGPQGLTTGPGSICESLPAGNGCAATFPSSAASDATTGSHRVTVAISATDLGNGDEVSAASESSSAESVGC
ncbi:MAG: hypothetical protein HY814_08150 [Candidatus Riflebacteria bacterium]|nr:hypothetical protein [Candidatus Riflebacteria bacterium]